MSTSKRSVMLPTEKSNGNQPKAADGKTTPSPGRTAARPSLKSQLRIRKR